MPLAFIVSLDGKSPAVSGSCQITRDHHSWVVLLRMVCSEWPECGLFGVFRIYLIFGCGGSSLLRVALL